MLILRWGGAEVERQDGARQIVAAMADTEFAEGISLRYM